VAVTMFIDDVILANTDISPEKTAIQFEQQRLSYRELSARVNGLAAALLVHKLGPSQFAAVLLDPSEHITVAMLGIFRCGGVYAPMDPEHPDQQILEKLVEIKPLVIITQQRFSERLSTWGIPLLLIESIPLASTKPDHIQKPSASDPACIFFTSGTTGKAKGVVGNYESLTASIVEPSQHLQFSENDVLNSIARYAWSISMLELMAPLVAGGTSLILDKAKALNVDWLKQQAEQCTAFHCPPALLKTFAEHVDYHYPANRSLDGVRLVWYGGDTFPVETIACLQRVFPQAQIGTAYGATEIFGLSHCYLYPRHSLPQAVLIGKPVGSISQLLLGADGQPVVQGIEGELFMGGPRVAAAYWQRPELTAEKFPVIANQRYFATGDFARLTAEGDLEFLQRQDTQVKIRGIRIELGEVEYHLHALPAVKSAVVIAKEDGQGSKALCGFVVLHAGEVLTVAGIRQVLAEKLPDYMVPHTLFILDELPYTENFKIDRKALADYQAQIVPTAEIAGFAAKIAALWQEAANVSPQTIDDNFFDIGGNSLSAILLASLLSREIGTAVEVADIYRNPQLSQQSEQFSRLLQGESKQQLSHDAGVKNSSVGALAQLGLFFRELFERRSASITCTRYVTRQEGFDDELLRRSLQQLIERYKTLRTAVKPASGQLQLVLLNVPSLEDVSLVRNPGLWKINEQGEGQLLGKQSHRFNLRTGPLITAICSRLNTGEDLLQLTAHHIAADDNSMGRLAVDFIHIYDALLHQQSPQLQPISAEYDEFLVDQQQRLAVGSYDQQALVIGQRLEGLLPHIIDNPIVIPQQDVTESLSYNQALPAGVAKAASFTDVVAALSLAFNTLFGRTDFVFCAHVALRRDAPNAPRVGMFVNLLPVFTGVNNEHGVAEHARRTKRDFDEAMMASDVPYELILKKTETLRRLGRYPFDGFVNELRFEDHYPEGYSDVIIQRAFATDGHEISLSLIRSLHGDELKLESPAFADGLTTLQKLAHIMIHYLDELHSGHQG